jgi:hypothetical protein
VRVALNQALFSKLEQQRQKKNNAPPPQSAENFAIKVKNNF